MQNHSSVLRPDSERIALIVTDSDGASDSNISSFAALEIPTALIAGGSTGCSNAFGEASPAPNLVETVRALNAYEISLCSNSDAILLDVLGGGYSKPNAIFALTYLAKEESIVVSLNGAEIPKSDPMSGHPNWQPYGGSIQITTQMPPGSSIDVSYELGCLQPRR